MILTAPCFTDQCRKFNIPSSATPAKKPAANAFATTKLDAPSASPSNPFAKVQLNSGTATASPAFSFGAMPKSEPKPFLFGAPSSSQQSQLPLSKPKSDSTQIKTINRNFFQIIEDHCIKGHICTNLAPLIEQYIKVADSVQPDEECSSGDDVENNNYAKNNALTNFAGGPSSKSDENKPQPSSGTSSFSGFSFAKSSAPPPSTGTTFSFTGGSTPAPATAPSLSFGSKPALQNSGSSSSNPVSNEDDPTYNPDDGKLEIGQEENKDEEILYTVRAKLVRMKNGAWKKSSANELRLYRNLASDKKRIVMRNDAGKVMFNVSVSSGMPFKKVPQKTKKGGETWFVSFVAVEDESEGPNKFMLNVSKDDIDKFHEELEKMAA